MGYVSLPGGKSPIKQHVGSRNHGNRFGLRSTPIKQMRSRLLDNFEDNVVI